MRIAIPLFKDRVSPHFGSSRRLLLIDTAGCSISQEAIMEVEGEGAVDLLRGLVRLGVERLICGGIPTLYKEWLLRRGVEVVDNQTGVAREIVLGMLQTKT